MKNKDFFDFQIPRKFNEREFFKGASWYKDAAGLTNRLDPVATADLNVAGAGLKAATKAVEVAAKPTGTKTDTVKAMESPHPESAGSKTSKTTSAAKPTK